MRRQKANTFVGISDFLLALNNVIFLLFVFAILAIAAKTPPAAGVELKAEYIITADWDLAHDCDVDLWVRDPLGNIVWYHEREAGFMVLDRDDRGGLNNSITVNGRKVANPIRQETISIRGIIAGEYTVNVNYYLATQAAPVPVAVKIEKVNPHVEVVAYDNVMLEHMGQEETAARFKIADNGDVLDVNHRKKSLIQLTRSVRRATSAK